MFEQVEKILYKVYQSRRTSYSDRQLGSCGVCGNSALYVRKENYEKRFCSNLCNGAEVGLSELFPLGMKRVLESIDQSLWLQDLPSEILAQIILMIFDFRILTRGEWASLGLLRIEFVKVTKLRNVIDKMVFPGLRFIAPKVLKDIPFQAIGIFLGLTHLDFPQDLNGNWTPALLRMRNLTFLDMTMYDKKMSMIDLTQLTQVNKLVVYPGAKNQFIHNLSHIKDLSLPFGTPITMDAIIQHTQLTALSLPSYEEELNGTPLDNLSNLRKLSLQNCVTVTDRDIENLVQLRKLNMRKSNITDAVFSVLTNLEALKIQMGHKIRHEALSRMTQLTSLHTEGFVGIGNETLKQLTNLRKLSLTGGATQFRNGVIGGYIPSPDIDNALLSLTNLTHLNLKKNLKVRDEHLVNLTRLHFLNISIRSNITNQALQRMTNLRILDIVGNENITPAIIPFLPELQQILLTTDQYMEGGFKDMKKSIYLKISLY